MKLQLFQGFWLATAVTTVLVAQPVFAQVVQVTEVQLNSTDNGIEVILETPAAQQLQVLPRTDANGNELRQGNTYIVDIPNAQLRLPSGNTFRRDNPVAGITFVTVTNSDTNSIRVTVAGSSGVPKVELFDSDEGLIFGVTADRSEPQALKPQTPETPQGVEPRSDEPPEMSAEGADDSPETPDAVEPERETPDETSQEDESIEIVVTGQETGYSVPDASTATRIEVPIRDVPQSIQVIPREVIEDRQVVRLNELADNVSGVQPQSGYFGLSSQGYYIRGFPVLV